MRGIWAYSFMCQHMHACMHVCMYVCMYGSEATWFRGDKGETRGTWEHVGTLNVWGLSTETYVGRVCA